MKKIKWIQFFLIIVIFVCISFVGCGQSPSEALSGKWIEAEEDKNHIGNFKLPISDGMVLFSDGTGCDIDSDRNFTWIAENGTIKMVSENYYTYVYSYKVTNDTLELIKDDGDIARYQKAK